MSDIFRHTGYNSKGVPLSGCFNEKGIVPTNTTQRDITREKDENDWHTLQSIEIITAIASLFHDFGKASFQFQQKLRCGKKIADAYRHEWISLRLFEAFVGNSTDEEWLSRLAALNTHVSNNIEKTCLESLIKDGITRPAPNPFEKLPQIAKVVAWLILTHHFLPISKGDFHPRKLNNLLCHIDSEWNNARIDATEKDKKDCWEFNKNTAFASKAWCLQASEWGRKALVCKKLLEADWVHDVFSLHLARLSLMLGDHYYSGLELYSDRVKGDENFSLYANTNRDTGKLKQQLDEHLIGVAKAAVKITAALPQLQQVLPKIARHKGFKQRATSPKFRWQDKAYDLACALRDRSFKQGFFGVNMASTGCGKTLANGRIMYGLANPHLGARFSIALGLRTLTLQTGEVYRKRFELGEDDLAILIGSSAVKELFELNKQKDQQPQDQKITLAASGSESAEPLMPDNTYVHYSGSIEVGPLRKWLEKSPEAKRLISAPILTCTVDHLIGATEATKGGKQIAPMLRLLTSDLILDEPDDFDIADLPALSRLVHWAGMLGSRVLLSSATLPPALIQGLFDAYRAGRAMYQKSRGIPGKAVNICCAWFDEHNTQSGDCADVTIFEKQHKQFVSKRMEKIRKTEVRRRAIIHPITTSKTEEKEIHDEVAVAIHAMLHDLHQQHHMVDKKTGKKISFGLIRIANIDPLIDIAQYLFKLGGKDNHRIKLCCYHARHPLLVRSNIEQQLDRLLNRNIPEAIFDDNEIRKILDTNLEDNLIFVVIASPVAEVGRDHDYDWAIVEPSSMRSIIQLAGRIKRHREGACSVPNIYLLGKNIKGLKSQIGTPVFTKPGFEKKHGDKFLLVSHDLKDLLTTEQYEAINALPRIYARDNLTPRGNLVDLEHARLRDLMFDLNNKIDISACLWWHYPQATLGAELQWQTQFRKSQPQTRYALLLEEDGDKAKFHDLEGDTPKACDYLFHKYELIVGNRIEPWVKVSYEEALIDLAEQKDMDLWTCGLRFGVIDLDDDCQGQGWCHNPHLGLRRK